MAAYLILNLGVKDRDESETYRQRVAPLVEKHGGRHLVRGGELQTIEGGLGRKRLVVLGFPSIEASRRPRRASASCCGRRRRATSLRLW